MTTEVEGIVARMKTHPPTGSRDLAHRLKSLWAAYPPATRNSLKRRYSYPYCPDVTDAGSTKQAVLATLLNSEADNFDVSPCWEALDRGINPTLVKHMLCKAKKAHQANPQLVFRQHLVALLDNPKGKRRRRKARRKEVVTQIHQRRPAPGAPPSPPPQKESPMPSYLREPTQSYARVRAHSLGLSELDYIHQLVDKDCEASGTIDYVEKSRLRDLQRTPQAAVAAAKPEKKVRPRKAKPQSATPSARPTRDKPPLHERIQIVMGKETVGIPVVIKRLRARGRGWLPVSKDLNAYISLALSTRKSIFERVSRGVYKVRQGSLFEELGLNVADNPFATAAA